MQSFDVVQAENASADLREKSVMTVNFFDVGKHLAVEPSVMIEQFPDALPKSATRNNRALTVRDDVQINAADAGVINGFRQSVGRRIISQSGFIAETLHQIFYNIRAVAVAALVINADDDCAGNDADEFDRVGVGFTRCADAVDVDDAFI